MAAAEPKQESFWEKAKGAAKKAADATKTAAKKAQLKMEIQSLQMKIKDSKSQFGVHVYPLLEASNQGELLLLLNNTVRQ
jgi:hypothetical protein